MNTTELEMNVGLLTRTGDLNGFVTARCACGYPCVIEPQNWGHLYGCAVCHEAEKQRMDDAQRTADRLARAEAKEKAQAEQNRQFWSMPHVDELSPRLKRLFKALIDSPSFSLSSIASMTKTSPQYAWEKFLLPLISANVLIELQGYLGQSRPYTADRPYELLASNASNYRVRGIAVRQMRDLEAAEVPEPETTPTVKVYSTDVLADEVRDFLAARCITGPDQSESEVMLRAKYVAFAEARHEIGLTVDEWYTTLGL
jgi:hypothetical protein